jgi:hypothetical protein
MLRKSIGAGTLLSVIVFFLLPWTKKDFITGFISSNGGWTVALMKVKNDSNFMNSVNIKLSQKNLLIIPNNSTEYGDSVEFNADPFVFEHGGKIYLFVETKLKGKGAHLSVYLLDKSEFRFEYLGVALDEPFHLSYPALHNLNSTTMLIPEMQSFGESWAYVTDSFPFNWRRTYKISDEAIKDPTLLKTDDNLGYIYYSKKNSLFKRGFSFDSLTGYSMGQEIFVKTGVNCRPGGSPFITKNYSLLFLQNNSKGYGYGLVSYNIANKEEICFLKAQTNIQEFSGGMHHFSSIVLGDSLLVAVDGNFLLSDKLHFSFKKFIKLNYLQVWSFWFPNVEPYYPFNF